MSLEDQNPIFGRVLARPYSRPSELIAETVPFILHAYGLADDELRVVVSDFRSNTFQGFMSRNQLENLRDDIGIGGSWSDFVDYITTSLRSDVKLVIEAVPYGRLIAQKAKGLPKVSLHLNRLVGADGSEANANLAMKLYEEFNNLQRLLQEEKDSKHQLKNVLAAEQEKSSTLRERLDMAISPRKRHSNSDASVLPDKHAVESPSMKREINRIVPSRRRSKLRGAVLHDVDK